MRSRKLRLIIPLTVAVAFLMEQLDSTIIATAIPDIARSLAVTPLQLNLAITCYILSLAVFIPVSGWFADRFGARRVFVAALAVFSIASALCGQSHSSASSSLCGHCQQLTISLGVAISAALLRGIAGADEIRACGISTSCSCWCR